MPKYIEYKVEKDNLFAWLYDIVEKNAKDLGLDIGKEGIKVSFLRDIYDLPLKELSLKDLKNNASMRFKDKKMYIGTDFLLELSKRVKNPDNFDAALEGVIRHELQHYKDYKKGIIKEWYPSEDELNREGKKHECRADFVSPGNEGWIEFHKKNDFFYIPEKHPSGSERMQSLVMQSHIKEHTKSEANPDGITLTPDDVEFNGKCEFSITNKDKLHAIPAEVLVEAYNKAERNVPKHLHHSSPEEKIGRVFSVQSVPQKPKAKQNWDARKGMEP